MRKRDYKLKQLILKREDSLKWHKSSHEIVKYFPQHYNKEGHYERTEWTSVWDIGRILDGVLIKTGGLFNGGKQLH